MSSKTKTTATKEAAKPALVPKLRFPEFQGAKAWENAPLGTLLKKNPDYGVNAAAVPFTELLPQYLRITDISDDGTYLNAKKVSVDLEPTDGIFLDEGDIVLARTGASVGKSYRYRKEDGRLVFAGFLIRVRPNPKRLDSTYLANFLTTNQYWKWVDATSARSGQPGINSVEYGSLEIPLPAVFAEQQKIAECLSSVDELIAAQARKVDALKTHKKGLMQQLFPREGETQPRLRFPEFQDAGEWEEYSLGQLIEIASGQVAPKQPPYCDLPQIGSENIESHSGKLVNVKSAGEKGVISGNYAFDENDILYSKIRPALNKVAAPSFKGICSADIYPIRPADGSLLRGYLVYLLLSQDFLDHAIRNSERGKIPKINREALTTYKALIPSPAEQQRIATCLSSLDALITAETQKHEALKTHKKGLMQQIFPSPEEVAA
jgi:type I restriction enzyme, S subunit